MSARAALLARLAELAAEQAEVFRELAALEAPPAKPAALPRRKRVVETPSDPGIVTDLGRERARRALRRVGVPLADDDGGR